MALTDTVAALPTNADMACGINDPCDSPKAKHAKVMSKALPCLTGLLHKTGCTLILVNQMRNKPDIIYGDPEYPTGGRAIGFYSSLRLRTLPVEQIRADRIDPTKGRREVIGHTMAVVVRKCKYGPQGMRTAVRLIYGEGLAPTH